MLKPQRPGPPLRGAVAVGSAALCAAFLAGCTATTSGSAGPEPVDPQLVAGLPITAGPNGIRPEAPSPDLAVAGGTTGPVDSIAESALADLAAYWSDVLPSAFHRPLTPVHRYVSWDSSAPAGDGPQFCGGPTAGVANAGFCRSRNEIGWDRGPLMTGLIDDYGDLAPAVVLAHEYGHVIQYQTGVDPSQTPTIVLEQQADCYAGVFIRHVAAGGAARLRMNTSDGLDSAMAVLVGIRDTPDGDLFGGAEHGSAFERATAFQIGFAAADADVAAAACSRIDAADVDERRGTIPLNAFLHRGRPAPAVDAESVRAAAASMNSAFALDPPPTLDTDATSGGCDGSGHIRGGVTAAAGPAVRYCPATDTVNADPGRLADIAQGLRGSADHGPGRTSGDATPMIGRFTAYSMLASRYALAAAYQRGHALTGDGAAARTACLVGAWIDHLATNDQRSGSPQAGGAGDGGGFGGASGGAPGTTDVDDGIRLRPGDVDDVIAELLTGGLAGADLHGDAGPSAFARVDAFRRGFDTGPRACFLFYP